MMRSGSVSVQQQTAILRIRLVDKKVFKKFNLFLNKPVKEARLTIAKELGVDPDQYGLFVPPKDEQTGKWCKDDYPLSFYGYEGEKESKESLLMTNAAAMEYMEFKKRYRPIRMLVASTGTTIVTKAVTIDDTKFVVDIIKDILEQMENPSIISEDELFSMHEDEYELLTSDMTIREQGFLGECTMGLYKREYEDDTGIYVKVPFAEGWIMRKRGGGVLKGLKNWNKRWYVLKKNKIMYYKSKSGVGQEALGSIPIKNIVHLKQAVVTDVPSKYEQFCFEIVTPARTFVMLAFSEHEFCCWMTHLENARRMFAHETIFLSPLQSTDQAPPSPNKTTTTEREQDKRKDIMIRGEQQRRMTLVILSEDDPVNINNLNNINNINNINLERQRPQMLKRVNTSPALSIQQRMAHMQKAGSPRSVSPSHSPRSVSPSHSPRSLSPSHSPPPTRSPRASSSSSSSSLSSSTVPASSSSVPSTSSSISNSIVSNSIISNSISTSSSPSSTNFSEASPPTAISSSASSSPSLSSSPSSGPSSNFLSASTPPPADSSPLAISYDSVSRLDESENEDMKSSNGSPAPETVFVGDQLFSDGASIEHIGDEWLGSSYLHEVDLRDDFSRTGFALVKSSSYMDDLAGTANFAPSASPISSSLSLSSTLSLSPFPSPPSSVLSFMYSPASLSSPSISPSSSLLSITAVPARLELDDLLPKELKHKEEPKEELKEEVKEKEETKEESKEETKEESKEEPKKEIKEPQKEVEQPKLELKEEEPKVEEPKKEIEEPKLDLKEPEQESKLDIKEEDSKKVEIPKIEIISPVIPKKEKDEIIIPTAAKSSPVKSESPFRPSSPTPSLPLRSSPSLLRFNSVQQHSVNNNINSNSNNANSPRLNSVNNTNISSPRSPRPPVAIPIPEEEVTEEDNEFIKANEELKYLFYEPRVVKTRGDLLRAWANYVVQKGNRPPINDWQAANKDLSVYLQLLHHHDSDTVSEKILKDNLTTESRASALSKALSDLGIEGFSSEIFLKGDFKTQRELLQAIFESVGSESMNEFYYDVISRRNASCRFINSTMKDDPLVAGIVPFHPLYSLKVLSDGSILCHLINKVYPGTIDTNSINVIKRVLHPTGVPRLILLALNCAIALGANSLKTLDPVDWADPNKKVRMLNELMWGVVEVCGLKYARPKENPALAPLQRTNEDKESFFSLSPIVVLIRWVNHHLRKHSLRTINNLSDDLEDGENYMILIDAIAHGKVPRKQWQITLGDNDWEKRASAILQAAKLLGCRMLITPRDICEAENVRLAPLFLAELLRVKNGFTQTEIDESTNARLTKSNKETQAEVAFSEIQPWLESFELGIDIDVSETFKDGTVFLKILDAIAPGAVDPKWLKVEPKGSRFKMVELANKTLEIASSLKINTTNIGGVDLVNGDIRPTVSLLNQFSRYGKTEVKSTSQSKIGIVSLPPSIVWANSQVAGQGKTTKLMSYKDQLVREGRFLIDLVSSLYPKVVNPSFVSPGQTEEEQEHNARYLLSLLWSLGISVSVLWQDIVSVRSQAIKSLMETLHNHYDEKTKQKV